MLLFGGASFSSVPFKLPFAEPGHPCVLTEVHLDSIDMDDLFSNNEVPLRKGSKKENLGKCLGTTVGGRNPANHLGHLGCIKTL